MLSREIYLSNQHKKKIIEFFVFHTHNILGSVPQGTSLNKNTGNVWKVCVTLGGERIFRENWGDFNMPQDFFVNFVLRDQWGVFFYK